MANQKICLDCGTEYSAQQTRCPLCGSSQWEPAPEPAPAPTPTPRAGQSAKSSKKAKPAREVDDGMPRSLVIASTVLVFLAVVALGWHILAQWIPGLPTFGSKAETTVTQPGETTTDPSESSDTACWYLSCEQKTLSFNEAGQSAQLVVKTEPSPTSDSITYTSLDAAVATVDGQGKVTAVADGETSIRITCGAMSVDVQVVCKFGVPIIPKLSDSEVEFTEIGQTKTVTVENLSSGQSVSWRSSSQSVATVDSNGQIVAVGAGTCTITAQIDAQTLNVTVTVKQDGVTTGTVNTDGVRFRSEPSTDGDILEELMEGDQLTILGESDGWYHAEYEGTEGYISADYVDVA